MKFDENHVSAAEELIAAIRGAGSCRVTRWRRLGIWKLSPVGQEFLRVPYWITVGLPVTVQPGTVTTPLPQTRKRHRTPRPGVPSRLGLVSGGWTPRRATPSSEY